MVAPGMSGGPSNTEIKQVFATYFMGTKGIIVNDNGTVDAHGSVNSRGIYNFDRLPVDFYKVSGPFKCPMVGLTTLDGAPKFVGGAADFSNNRLTKFKNQIEKVFALNIASNLFESLQNGPQVTHFYDCSSNRLTDLVGAPVKLDVTFDCSNNKFLTTLNGCPEAQQILARSCNLKTLEGAPSVTQRFDIRSNSNLTSLNGLPNVTNELSLTAYPHLPLLRLLFVDCSLFLYRPDSLNFQSNLIDLINKYHKDQSLTKKQKILTCQKEMIDAGFLGNASY
jgi:hypothetical protein